MPTVAMPIRLVQSGEDNYADDNHHDRELVKSYMHRTCSDSAGCPVGVQVSCLPYEDEKVVGICMQLEKIVPFPYLPLGIREQYRSEATK